MRAESVIYALLNASPAVAAVVGDRIYLDTRPESDPLPAIVYELVSDKPDAPRIGETETVTARMQVNCLGNVADDLVSLRESVRVACHNQSGTIGGSVVVWCFQDGTPHDSYDELVNAYTKSIDFIIHYLR
ncbi:MAG: DUF3168 domain-containing protein [Betaproteobacteria bacterium]|nr:DUF3168 domain-containing protein [Betaproteobacteria bacterium]